MQPVLVVAYSYTGTSRQLARWLCAEMEWDFGEVRDTRPRAGGQGTLRCVLDSLLRRHPAITYDGPDPAGYATVVLVAPIWMYRLAGPMRSFVAAHTASLPRVGVINTMGAAGAVDAVAEIASLLGRPPVVSIAFTAAEVDAGQFPTRLREFAASLQPSAAERPVRPVTLSPEAA